MSADQLNEDELLATPKNTPEKFQILPGTQPDVPDLKIHRIISGKNKKPTK